ncbi:unnamed protein product, partial [Ectocarpus sp. 13 AM-2016]
PFVFSSSVCREVSAVVVVAVFPSLVSLIPFFGACVISGRAGAELCPPFALFSLYENNRVPRAGEASRTAMMIFSR